MESEPLLDPSGVGGGVDGEPASPSIDAWRRSYQQLRKHPSLRVPAAAAASGARSDGLQQVTPDDLRSASTFYPPISDLLEPVPPVSSDSTIASQGIPGDYQPGNTSSDMSRETLDEVEIRQLLISHVKQHLFWGGGPAREWKISSIDNCNVYVGTLETFIEEREAKQVRVPYRGTTVDDHGPAMKLWEIDLRAEYPILYVPEKEITIKIPHSDAIRKCVDCEGKGKITCLNCNALSTQGLLKENRMFQCSTCRGRGLIAHRDGSDTLCQSCHGKGVLPCQTCESKGVVDCKTCEGLGNLLQWGVAHVRWRTLSVREVKLSNRGAASVPQDVLKRAKGVQLCNIQAKQCTPSFFPDSYDLNRFSSEVIQRRPHIPPAARVVVERHIISCIPVTRATMEHGSRSFSFYIIGDNLEVYLSDYPSKFSLCCCF